MGTSSKKVDSEIFFFFFYFVRHKIIRLETEFPVSSLYSPGTLN